MFPPQAVLAANPNGFPQGMVQPIQFAAPFPQAPAPQPFPTMPVQNMAAEVPPRPRIRLQAAEEPVSAAPRPMTLPAPETFGVGVAVKVDWAATRTRLQQLGATNFRVDELGAGGCRVRILLTTNQAGGLHEIETTAGSEVAAVTAALAQAERWKTTK